MIQGHARARFLFDEIDERLGERDLPLLSVSATRGVVARSEITDDLPRAEDLTNYKVCQPDDIIVNRMSAYQGALGRSRWAGIVSPDYVVLRPNGGVKSRWLAHVMRSPWFVSEMASRVRGIGSIGTGNVRTPRVSAEEIGDIVTVVPSAKDQDRIADFLDTETVRIDQLIAAKLQMIELAVERASAGMSEDIEQIGTGTVPLKRVSKLIDCKHRTPDYVESGYPVVSPGDVEPGHLDVSRCHRFVSETDWLDLAEGDRRPRVGDIVYSRNASVGLAALVTPETPSFCMGQDVCLVRPGQGDGRFLTHVLNTSGMAQIERIKIGSTFSRINVAQIAELRIPAVSGREQDDLAQRWDARFTHRDELTATLARQIELLREHRQALITAAVTGELEVA